MKTVFIFDEASVHGHTGVSFHLNSATKHRENPVLLPGEPHQWDSLQVSWPATVLYSAEEKLFRCWYSGLDCIQGPGRRWWPGYAESTDGIHWEKPELGQVTFLDRDTNQMASPENAHCLSLVFANPLPDAPEAQRFGSYWVEQQADDSWTKGLAWSADGRRWTREQAAYTMPDRKSYQDICQLLYDTDEPDPAFRVKGYTQIFQDGRRPNGEPAGWPGLRNIGLVHGESFENVQDAAEPVILAPQPGIDEELHFASVLKVGQQYLMLFESDRFSKNPIQGDLRVAVSGDGRQFRRIHSTQALIGTGPKGFWDENLLVTTTASMQNVGDEIYIFYIGCPNIYNSWPAQYAVVPERRGSMIAPSYMGVAMLPRDRFAYAQGSGSLTLHLLELNVAGLWLNVEGTDVTVTALDAAGNPTAHGRPGAERNQTVYRKIAWNGPAPLGTNRLRVDLGENTRLFSVRA